MRLFFCLAIVSACSLLSCGCEHVAGATQKNDEGGAPSSEELLTLQEPFCLYMVLRDVGTKRLQCVDSYDTASIPKSLLQQDVIAVLACVSDLSCAALFPTNGKLGIHYLHAAGGSIPNDGTVSPGCVQFLDNDTMAPLQGVRISAIDRLRGLIDFGGSDERGIYCGPILEAADSAVSESQGAWHTFPDGLVFCLPGYYCGALRDPAVVDRGGFRCFLQRMAIP